MNKNSIVLTQEQRSQLEKKISRGSAPAAEIRHANILLKTDEGPWGPHWTDEQIMQAYQVSDLMAYRVRKRFHQQGLQQALQRAASPMRPEQQSLDGAQEAHLVRLACTTPPEGYSTWSIRLLQRHLIQLEVVEHISHETVRLVLKKNELKPWLKKQWCIPPTSDAAFVCAMEDVLSVYHRPYDASFPLICMDEGCKQLLSETEEPLPAHPATDQTPATPARYDYHYEREGVCNVFIASEPLTGTRMIRLSPTRKKADWAYFLREVLDGPYRDAPKVLLVMDNLNTHTPSSFYEVFEPEEARRLTEKLEIHHTPKHGSWLNMAEIELSVLGRQALSGRIGSQEQMQQQVDAWSATRNQEHRHIEWRFTTADARIKLRRLYPTNKG